MNDLNKVFLIGRLTQDLGTDERSFAYTSGGMARANVSIAVNHSRKTADGWADEVDYFTVTIWDKTAENLKPYLTKGKQIVIEGRLKQNRWEKDGQKQSRVSIVAENVQLLGGRNDGGSTPRPAQQQSAPAASGADYSDDFPEDIPF